jgi:hypothetical protein
MSIKYIPERSGPTGPAGPAGAPGGVGATGLPGDWATAQTVVAKSSSINPVLAADAGLMFKCTNISDITLTLTSTSAFSVGQSVDLVRYGSGNVTVAQGSGATVTGTPGLKLRALSSAATIFCIAANEYVVIGDLTT